MNQNIRQDVSYDDIRLNLHALEQIAWGNMDIFHARIELNIFLSDTNRYIIQVIGKDFLGTKKGASNGEDTWTSSHI